MNKALVTDASEVQMQSVSGQPPDLLPDVRLSPSARVDVDLTVQQLDAHTKTVFIETLQEIATRISVLQFTEGQNELGGLIALIDPLSDSEKSGLLEYYLAYSRANVFNPEVVTAFNTLWDSLSMDERTQVEATRILGIQIDDLQGDEIAVFLQQHIDDMRAVSPPESKHALDIDGLRAPAITFWTMYDDGALVGCGALKELDPFNGEVKSMRVQASCRGKGVGSQVLVHLIQVARSRGYRTLKLETGSMPF